MTKEIITGTKITFKETGDKFTLTQTDTGFDLRQVKLSKNLAAEPYTFQELLELYESGQITIEGFEETDAALARSIITNYIYNSNIKTQLNTIEQLTAKNKELTDKIEQLNSTIAAMQED